MIKKDVQAYAISNWESHLGSISELSKNNQGISLVESSIKLYNFDSVCKSLFEPDTMPTSTDGLSFSSGTIELIEFKSGFKQRITKYNFNPEEGKCIHKGQVCKDYWNLFFKNQDLKISQLISSIRFKAIESYITLEKRVFPLCQDVVTPISLKLLVVIDEDGIDSIEDIYSELAGNTDTENTVAKHNPLSAIRSALRRLKNLHDANNNDYLYDCIEVLSVQDYLNKLNQMA